MSLNSWRFLIQLKDTIFKLIGDKSLQTDFVQLLSKIPQPHDLGEYIKTTERRLASAHQSVQQFYNSALTERFKDEKNQEEDGRASWKKVKRFSQTQHSLQNSFTVQILDSIEWASSAEDVLFGIEALISHLKEHPEIRNNAIKHGAVRILLNTRRKSGSNEASGALREALALLGHVEPVAGRGIRILSIDGGGIRGVLVLEMLKKLEELTGKRAYEMFDFFCGVSTGAILSYSMGVHLRNLDDIMARYEALCQEIFNQSRILGTGKLVWSHAYYDTGLWEKKLKEYVGSDTLISTSRNPKCPKICVVSAVVNQSQVSAYVFRNYAFPWRFQSEYEGSCNSQVWEAVRASAAAPTYFEEFRIKDLIHQDGGIVANNPTAIAIHEAKLLWPNTPIQCVVSFGTGRSVPSPTDRTIQSPRIGSDATSWTNKFLKILDSATDTQAVHIMLSDLLPGDVYYRFNPYLTEVIGMVETDQEKHTQMKRDTLMYLRRNEDKFHQAANTLMLEKTAYQKVMDQILK